MVPMARLPCLQSSGPPQRVSGIPSWPSQQFWGYTNGITTTPYSSILKISKGKQIAFKNLLLLYCWGNTKNLDGTKPGVTSAPNIVFITTWFDHLILINVPSPLGNTFVIWDNHALLEVWKGRRLQFSVQGWKHHYFITKIQSSSLPKLLYLAGKILVALLPQTQSLGKRFVMWTWLIGLK